MIIDGGVNQLNVAKRNLGFDKIVAFTKDSRRKSGILYNYNGEEIVIKNEGILMRLEYLRGLAHDYVKSKAKRKFESQYKE